MEIRILSSIMLVLSLFLFTANRFVLGEKPDEFYILMPKMVSGERINLSNALNLGLHLKTSVKSLTIQQGHFSFDNENFLKECTKELSSRNSSAACLIMKTSSTAESTSENVIDLAPAVVFLKPKPQPSPILNFTNIFHSSVWSFILLFLLLTIILMIGSEIVHPFGYRSQNQWNLKNPKKLRPSECVFLVFGGLLLKSHTRLPVSIAGKILLIFWSFHVICITFIFIGGLMITIFVNGDPTSISSPTNIKDLQIQCQRESILCQMTNKIPDDHLFDGWSSVLKYGIRKQDSFRDLVELLLSGHNMTGLLTDSLTARQLMKKYDNVTAFRISHPIASLAFKSYDRKLIQEMNSNLLQLRETGIDLNSEFTVTAKIPHNDFEFLALILPIRLDTTMSVFYIMVAAYVIVFIVLISEFLSRLCVKKDEIPFADEDGEENVAFSFNSHL